MRNMNNYLRILKDSETIINDASKYYKMIIKMES